MFPCCTLICFARCCSTSWTFLNSSICWPNSFYCLYNSFFRTLRFELTIFSPARTFALWPFSKFKSLKVSRPRGLTPGPRFVCIMFAPNSLSTSETLELRKLCRGLAIVVRFLMETGLWRSEFRGDVYLKWIYWLSETRA